VTGKKEEEKLYRRHSGRPGGMKIETLKVLKSRIPERILEKAVQGMLPKTSLGRKMFTRLRVFTESIHPHSAQCK
jgi:large subunit ribosomal protein L13